MPRYDASYATELFKGAMDLARATVDLVAFSTGHGLTVVLDAIIGADGIPPFVLNNPALPPLCTAYGLEPPRQADFATIYKLVVEDFSLLGALHDLAEVLTTAHVSCVNCGRVVDGIRRMITPDPSVSDTKAWQAMHHALNVSRAYQQWITDQSKGPRHGDRAFAPGNITAEVANRT